MLLSLDDLVASGEENFFDLGGWIDAAGDLQPEVTATSQNTFSNRDNVAILYSAFNNDALSNSRFWYHAELFSNDRLRPLLGTVHAPDLGKVLDILKNAALLCYYFFFPAHEELLPNHERNSVPLEPCTNVEAKEFNSFAGEWACMSVLLERSDPAGNFLPSFLGFTGRLTQNATAAQAADQDNLAKGLVMTVAPFNNPQVALIEEHPQLFVSNGTHAFYLAPGTNTLVFPADSQPYDYCGRFEGTPLPAQPYPSYTSPGVGVAIVFGKMLAGNGLFGPIGALAGLIWGAVELAQGNYGEDLGVVGSATDTVIPNDDTGPPGTGKVVRPKGLAVPLDGTDQQDWMSQQGLVAPDGRRYDFLVDRNSQLWWPGDFQGGYQGRWGPRVEQDPFDRRAGMKFPAFWRMFFLALANGKAQSVF